MKRTIPVYIIPIGKNKEKGKEIKNIVGALAILYI
jgi:hypothetical protein